jgi:hypothetical protein
MIRGSADGTTRSAVHRLDGRVQRRQIEPLDETPYQTRPVILRQQPIQADRSPGHLIALGNAKTGQPSARPLRRRLLRQSL